MFFKIDVMAKILACLDFWVFDGFKSFCTFRTEGGRNKPVSKICALRALLDLRGAYYE
jgi:hypothetical protein